MTIKRTVTFAIAFLSLSMAQAMPIYSPYKDVTVNFNSNNNVISTKIEPGTGDMPTPVLTILKEIAPSVTTVTWAFATGECGQEQWGWLQPDVTAKFASTNVSQFVAANKNYIISTGGAAGVFTCSTDKGMDAFIAKYYSPNMVGLDFDIEASIWNFPQDQVNALVKEIGYLKSQAKYKNLKISFTLGAWGGTTNDTVLNEMGNAVFSALKTAKFPYTINLMVMDYAAPAGSGKPLTDFCVLQKGSTTLCDMVATAKQAAINLNKKYNIPFANIELTPMIGQNDQPTQKFMQGDVELVVQFAKDYNLAGLHTWSLDRDTPCTGNTSTVSPTCSGVAQNPGDFMNLFSTGLQ